MLPAENSPATIRASTDLILGGRLKEIVERALAQLRGLDMWGFARSADLLTVQFGDRRSGNGAGAGAFALDVACAWRIAAPTAILVASGDLFTPADSDADLESFDWDVSGASWWDAQMAQLPAGTVSAPLVVTTFLADSLGGFRLVCTGGIELEVFPNSSPAPHVETEFWRLRRPGLTDAHVVVGTMGVELIHQD